MTFFEQFEINGGKGFLASMTERPGIRGLIILLNKFPGTKLTGFPAGLSTADSISNTEANSFIDPFVR